jgi:hypothetical protein
MSQLSNGFSIGIFGAIAVSLTFGAIASGHDLTGGSQAASGISETTVNRIAKADRAAEATASAIPTRTVSFRLQALSDTSVLVRVPVVIESRNTPRAPSATTSGDRKMAVACEPLVSVLTEVAKLLQPGRCVT